MNLWHRAYLALRQAERTQARWSNPLSIYGPDPKQLATVQFNASREEGTRELRERAEHLRRQIAEVRS